MAREKRRRVECDDVDVDDKRRGECTTGLGHPDSRVRTLTPHPYPGERRRDLVTMREELESLELDERMRARKERQKENPPIGMSPYCLSSN